MSKTLTIALLISASLSGSFNSAMSGTNRTLERMGKTVDDLRTRQNRLRDGIAALPSVYSVQFDSMMTRYRQLGAMIDDLSMRQRRLTELTQRGSALRDERREIRGRMGEAVAGAVAVGAPAVKAVRVAAGFEDQIKDIAITGNLPRLQEMKLGKSIRENAIRTNQTQAELAQGVSVLVANGMQVSEARTYSRLLGKTATATRGQMDELSQLMFSLNTSFKISGEQGMQQAFDFLAHAGKQGQFELKHMARYFPELGAAMASFGSTGLSAVKELGMAMQVARKYAGTNEEAATNARNWFSHMTANTTVENFKRVGVDYRGEIMKRMQQQKISALQASLQVTDDFIDRVSAGKTITVKKGRKVEQLNFRDALDRARASGDEGAVKSVVERFGLSKIFQDMQTLNFYMAMRQGKDIFKQGMASYDTAEAKGVIDRDFAKRMEASTERFKTFKLQATELGIAVGESLLPPLTRFLAVVTPIVGFVGGMATRFPRLTGSLVALSTGLFIGRLAWLAAAYGGNVFMSTLVGMRTVVALAQAKLALLRLTTAGWSFGRLITGIRGAALAVRGFSMALFANPVGLVVAGVVALAASAYLIYRYWGPIKGFFNGIWKALKGISWFQAGLNIIDSLWQGMKSKASKPVELIKSIAQRVRNFLPFSPAKEGPLRDIHRIKLVETIADSMKPAPMVNAMRAATAATMLAVTPVGSLAHAAGGGAGGSMVIHYSPQIIVQGGGNAEQIQGAVNQAIAASYPEFERMMQRYESQRSRRQF